MLVPDAGRAEHGRRHAVLVPQAEPGPCRGGREEAQGREGQADGTCLTRGEMPRSIRCHPLPPITGGGRGVSVPRPIPNIRHLSHVSHSSPTALLALRTPSPDERRPPSWRGASTMATRIHPTSLQRTWIPTCLKRRSWCCHPTLRWPVPAAQHVCGALSGTPRRPPLATSDDGVREPPSSAEADLACFVCRPCPHAHDRHSPCV